VRFDTEVIGVVPRTHNVKSFRFLRPSTFIYKPGQFMFVILKKGSEQMKKPFSISSSPSEGGFIEFTKKLTGHPFSMALEAMRVGDLAAIDGPYGNFTFEGEPDKVGMMSGGVGITPLRSICRYCTDMQSKARITLLYGNRTEREIVFREELEEMQRLNENLKIVFTVDEASESWTGRTGMIDADMIKNDVRDYLKTTFYICGPPAMVEAMRKLLSSMQIPERQTKIESFQGY
jgi:ferredoxin-NADP reductase